MSASGPAASTPRPIAWMDGRVVPASEATVPLLDEGFQRGDAVFETILVRHGRTHALDGHLARMRNSAKQTGIRLPALRQPVTDLLAAWGDRNGVLKLIVTRSGTVRGLVRTVEWPDAISLAVVEVPWRSVLSGAKTLSYATNQWATREAQAHDADDALVVEDGIALELPTAAVCIVSNGRVRTPDAARLPILESVTVETLSQVVPVERAVLSLDDVRGADELFVLSATRPILPVHALDDVEYPAPGPVTAELQERLAEHIEASLDPVP